MWVPELEICRTGVRKAVRRVSLLILQVVTVLALHWPTCVLFASFVLSGVSMSKGRKERKKEEKEVLYPKDSRVWTSSS